MPDTSSNLQRIHGPLWRQAADRLRVAIGEGRVPVGTELPVEGELAQRFGVSLITVRHALRALEAEGLIRKRAAKAAIVVARDPPPVAREMTRLEDVIAATEGTRLEIESYRAARSAEAAAVFGLPADAQLFRLRGRLLVEEAPLSEIVIHFPPEIGKRLHRADFDDVVVFRSVERRLGIRIAAARNTIGAELADAALARALDVPEGSAVLASRITYLDAAGQPVEFTVARHRADRYRVSYEFSGR